MSTTYINRLYINDVYNTFAINRKNKLTNYGVTSDDDTTQLKFYHNGNTTYIYADKTSPYPFQDEDMNTAYLQVGNTSYNIYRAHSYTYTEGITMNNENVKLIMLAYNFVQNHMMSWGREEVVLGLFMEALHEQRSLFPFSLTSFPSAFLLPGLWWSPV